MADINVNWVGSGDLTNVSTQHYDRHVLLQTSSLTARGFPNTGVEKYATLTHLVNPVTAVSLVDETNTPTGVTRYGGGIFTVSQNYLQSLSEGDIPSHAPFEKIGYSAGGTTTETSVWPGATAYVFPVSAQAMACVSSSTQDAAAGTGVKTIRIFYLDVVGIEKTIDVALSGTSVATTSATDIFRINDVKAVNFGSGAVTYRAVGNIDVRSIFTTPIYARIAIGFTRARAAVYTVPAGKTVYITNIAFGATKGSSTGNTAIFTLRSSNDLLMGPLTPRGLNMAPIIEVNIQDGSFERHFDVPVKLLENTDFRTDVICGQTATICTASWRGWIE